MSEAKAYAGLSRAALVERVIEQEQQIAELQELLATLQAEVARLKRAGRRQAAPFATGKRKAPPRRPGRKPGQGEFQFRALPLPEEVTESPIDVPVAQTTCPACGGRLVEEGEEWAYRTEVPPLPQPQVTPYRVHRCRGVRGGQRVRGQHPDLASGQSGASAHRLGDRVFAIAHTLQYGRGVPVRKVPTILAELRGVRVTQGALTADAQRRAAGSGGQVYEQLRARVPSAPTIPTEDTGWRIGGQPAHLMVFETEAVTVYQIRERHRNDEVREIVPADYAGVVVTERGRSYDAEALAGVRQQKCLAHIQRSLSEVLGQQRGRARTFGLRLKALFQEALELWHAYHQRGVPAFTAQVAQREVALTEEWRPRRFSNAANQRLLNELGWQQDRGNLLRFLADPRIEPTNNRAERALRPAVIARKLSHCSKTTGGARTFAAFTSVLRTIAQTHPDSLVDGLVHVFRSTELPPCTGSR